MSNTSINIKNILESLNLTTEEWAEIADYASKKSVSGHSIIKEERTPVDKNLTKDNIYIEVSNILKMIGIPPSILGYIYLREAVILAYQDWTYVGNVVKGLYPAIADKYDTTPSRVERAMRHAVEIAFERGDTEILNKYFYSANNKPTTSEVIATLADFLKM